MTQRVLIAGAGLLGLGVARQLAASGCHVSLFDPRAPGVETSLVSAGMLAPHAELRHDEEDLLALGRASQALWPRWVEALVSESGVAIDVRMPGTLVVAYDGDEYAAARHHLDTLERQGLQVDHLDASDLRDLEPDLSPHLVGGGLIHGDGQVDNRALLDALRLRAEALGVTILSGIGLQSVEAVQGRVAGATDTAGDTHPCDAVVIAAGSWSRSIRLPDLPPLPVRPVRGQLLAFASVDRLGRRLRLERAVHAPSVYMALKADGTLLAGATMEERGHEREVNTGALFEHLREARRLLPQLDELPLRDIRIGFRPTSRDNRPLLGETEIAGLFCLTGHARNGVQQAPASIEIVAAAVLGQSLPAYAEPFSPKRFTTRAAR